MAGDKKYNGDPADSITFDGSAESLAAAIELILSTPVHHDFGCRPRSGHCTLECIHRRNVRMVAETALLEFKRTRSLGGEEAADPQRDAGSQWRH
jgi:hypothetical protein